jgi:hypothetical protein
MKDTAAIPTGNRCYRLVRMRPGESLSRKTTRFGNDLREYPFGEGWKAVLCPYWYRTDYGMVCCDYLKVQSLDEDDSDAKDKAIRHFGSEELFESANMPSFLYDEMKICEIRQDADGE